jgi:hypothetical protein
LVLPAVATVANSTLPGAKSPYRSPGEYTSFGIATGDTLKDICLEFSSWNCLDLFVKGLEFGFPGVATVATTGQQEPARPQEDPGPFGAPFKSRDCHNSLHPGHLYVSVL